MKVRRQRTNSYQFSYRILEVALIAISVIASWKSLIQLTKCDSPLVVVASGLTWERNFERFSRGDILLLNALKKDTNVGDLVAIQLPEREALTVHRIVTVHEKSDGSLQFLTKGDTNRLDDRGLYAPNQMWLERGAIRGWVVARLPYLGIVTLLFHEYPIVPLVLIGMATLFILFSHSSKQQIEKARKMHPL